MFNPSKDQVRDFFCDAWRKYQHKEILSPLETMAADLILQHPEYHADLQAADAKERDYSVESGRSNPFLHLSMHLAIQEQVSVDQPPGIRPAYTRLCQSQSAHAAEHVIMEALGQVIWEAQRLGTPFDNDHYLDLILRNTTHD